MQLSGLCTVIPFYKHKYAEPYLEGTEGALCLCKLTACITQVVGLL